MCWLYILVNSTLAWTSEYCSISNVGYESLISFEIEEEGFFFVFIHLGLYISSIAATSDEYLF